MKEGLQENTTDPSGEASPTQVRVPAARISVRGLKTFFKLVVGHDLESAHEQANTILLLVGIFIEFNILGLTVMEIHGRSKIGDLVFALLTLGLILISLSYHQFALFRNFLADERNNRARNVPVAGDKTSLERRQLIEIYIVFGIVTGEIGYMVTIVTQYFSRNIYIEEIMVSMGVLFGIEGLDKGGKGLAQLLKVLFVLGAMLLCILVLWWDRTIWKSHSHAFYTKRQMKTFFYSDVWALATWTYIAFLSIPRLRLWLEGYASPFVPLLFFGLSYAYTTGKRLRHTLRKLTRFTDKYASEKLKENASEDVANEYAWNKMKENELKTMVL